MKQLCLAVLWLGFTSVEIHGQIHVVERGRHYKVTESIRQTASPLGRSIMTTNRYTTLGNGMNRLDAGGRWTESRPLVQLFPNAIVCTGASYRVILNPNLNTAGAVDVETSDRKRIVSHPLGIGFFDPASGASVLLAGIKNCQAEVSSNRIVFRDAFDGSGIEAAVTYRYDVGRFHQDITFVKRPSVTPADFGMSSRTRLELFTEILEAPEPARTERVLKREPDSAKRLSMVEPDLADESLNFGWMRMPLGRAFASAQSGKSEARRGVAVAKQLLNVDGRTVLVEAVEWQDVRGDLEKLPPSAAGAAGPIRAAKLQRELPAHGVAQGETKPFTARLAQIVQSGSAGRPLAAFNFNDSRAANSRSAFRAPEGLVVDYELVEAQDNFTFVSGQTYLIENGVWLSGVTTFESGAVIKYGLNASLGITSGEVHCSESGPKTIFTVADDNAVGEIIPDDPPSFPFAAEALDFEYVGTNFIVQNLDIRHASRGILAVSYPDSMTVRNCRFGHCTMGIDEEDMTVSVDSVQMCNVSTWFYTHGEYGGLTSTNVTGNCDVDLDKDGMWDSWELNHFGDLTQTGSSDYDGDGVSNANEFLFGTDPNTIRFLARYATFYVNTSNVSVAIELQGGVPIQQTVLVDNTNYPAANWTTYTSSNLTVNLGANEGWHEVWIALRGRTAASEQTWQWRRLKFDLTPPQLFTNSPGSVVSQPMIQLSGYSPEPLAHISCDISNAAGLVTNYPVSVMENHYDPTIADDTICIFQAFDLELTNGINTITFHATDRAGNAATAQFNFTLTSDATAPAMDLVWPQNLSKLSGDTFTVRGVVNDPTAAITAFVVDTNGVTNVFNGLVERDGKFWLENLPLSAGTNVFTLTAADAWTNLTTTNFSVVKSGLILNIDPVNPQELYHRVISVSGTVSDATYAVWVNGQPATVNVDGTWLATNVPVSEGGTATFDATAYPPGSVVIPNTNQPAANPAGTNSVQTGAAPDKDMRVYVETSEVTARNSHVKGHLDVFSGSQTPVDWSIPEYWDEYTHHWTDGKGGAGTLMTKEHYVHPEGPVTHGPCNSVLEWPATEWPLLTDGIKTETCEGQGNTVQTVIPPPVIVGEFCDVNSPPPRQSLTWSGAVWYSLRSIWDFDYKRVARTKTVLYTGGKSLPKKESRFVITGWVDEVLDKKAQPPFTIWTPTRPVPAQTVKIGDLGNLWYNGRRYVKLANNQTYDITPKVDGLDFYIYTLDVARPQKIRMSRSYHPWAKMYHEIVDVQKELDKAGDERLALDNDGWHEDGVAGADENDDVPTYVEFEIPDAHHLMFPTNFFDGAAWTNYMIEAYWRIEKFPTLLHLLKARFANIKQVHRITYKDEQGNEHDEAGHALTWAGSVVFTPWFSPTNSTPYTPVDLVLVHEFIHTTDMLHRDQFGTNPGDDPLAIMRGPPVAGANEVNRWEKEKIESWDREFWNED